MIIFRVIGRWWPRFSLERADLLAIFAMCNIAACVAGHDMIQILVLIIAYPQWHTAPENEWGQILLPHLHNGVTVTDKSTLSGYFVGESSLYTSQHLRHWITPVLCWSGFIFVATVGNLHHPCIQGIGISPIRNSSYQRLFSIYVPDP